VFGWDMLDTFAEYEVPLVLAGFGNYTDYAIRHLSSSLELDLTRFYTYDPATRRYDYGSAEKRAYYERLRRACGDRGMGFSVCYIGSPEPTFEANRDLWQNERDCCDIKGRVAGFRTDCQQVDEGEALQLLMLNIFEGLRHRSYF
jgi:hypothetical protein